MIATTVDKRFRIVVYEGVGATPLDVAVRQGLVRTLLEKGYGVTCVRPGGTVGGMESGTLCVLGAFGAGKPGDVADGDVKVVFAEVGGMSVDQMHGVVESARVAVGAAKPGGWKPWFPVIDYKRCTNCMQCLSFCLFDVYGVSTEGKIQVQKENNCKTDCPACSRVCPEVAILFPKYKAGPINGDEVNSDDVRREAMKIDISSLLGGDIYAALRDRSEKAKSRFSKERDEDRALKERTRCLTKLAENLDIPPEVLGSLPSIDQIQAKAEAAKARAAAALAANAER